MKKLLFILPLFALVACDKTITPDLGEPISAIVIDAWITDQGTTQDIFVMRSQPYFENEYPVQISGAEVYIVNSDGERFDFVETEESYRWTSPDGLPFGEEDAFYILNVRVEGEDFAAYTQMRRVPPIDSMKFKYNEETQFILQEYYTAEFVATDPVGEGDSYWFKTWKNGNYLNKPSEINIAFDAGFSSGGNVDGVVFIQPIQENINPFDSDPAVKNTALPPYLPGDTVTVEILSISNEAFYFLSQTATQTDRSGGFGALFAVPLSNVPSNIYNLDSQSKNIPYGFFNVGKVSSSSLILTQELANEAKRIWEEEN